MNSNSLNKFYQSITLMGRVTNVDALSGLFSIKLLSGDEVEIMISKTTWYEVLRNVGDEGRDRVLNPKPEAVEAVIGKRDAAEDRYFWDAKSKLLKYLKPGLLINIEGINSQVDGTVAYGARRIVLMHSDLMDYGFEQTHWWLQQTNTLFEQWLDVLFAERREFTENDFSEFYRTNLDLLGGSTENKTQECATMSRFLYGLASSYLLTGNNRALSAAKACAKYLVNAYSTVSHDGQYCFWKFGRVKNGKTAKEYISSQNPDDQGTYALYEQIYVLSGLTQYYRVTQDVEILRYIIQTIAAFQDFFLDRKREGDACFTGHGGYYSHIDPVTMRPDSPALDATGNREKKNWNSIGDHIPAYLINLLVSIDPLPQSDQTDSWVQLRKLCREILNECVGNILDYFPPEAGTKFVNERFYKDWSLDQTWSWQQNRGIVGHNLKISWNLTRCGHYYVRLADEFQREGNAEEQQKYAELAERSYKLAKELGHNMKEVGVDLIRGGIFDALERFPTNGMPTEFSWGNTKDFWQQEQAILGYYIMSGIDGGSGATEESKEFLELARYSAAFWNLHFIDHDNRKIFFRTTESGEPIIAGQYGVQGGHAIAGYHAFELNYLAHIYIRTFVPKTSESHDDSFVLYYCPNRNSSVTTMNVMPDFFRPDDLKIINIKINGLVIPIEDQFNFQIDISDIPGNSVIMVEYLPTRREDANSEQEIVECRGTMKNLDFKYNRRKL